MNIQIPELEVSERSVIRTKYPTTSREAVGCCYDRYEFLAPLFAASPKLLTALQALLSLHEPEGRFQPSHFKPVLFQARQAIAEARGEPVEQIGKQEYAYREALTEIANGATGFLDRDTDLANIAKRALGIAVDE
ncbi:MAG: hypothetical protein OSB38_18670 [Paraburkholderia fungorum]|nr:hypothetical protein [Paraburkholderia fungorum]